MSEKKQDENIIEIKDLVKKYKMFDRKKDRLIETIFPRVKRHTDFTAMNNLNLTIKKGEVLGILGKNGAGKSTLLKMITGVVIPTSGTLNIKGKISSLLELGTAFNSELTGEENIYQHGQVMGLTREEIEATKQDIIDFADIGDHLYQPVKTYSSGMFARLAFACAINVNPDILIVDEVLSVGDMAFQLKCFKKFEQFKEEGKTILFVTHSIADVLKNCTRTIILQKGEKIFDGGVKEGVELYKKIITGNAPSNDKTDAKKFIKGEIGKTWRSHFNENPNVIDYGNLKAQVVDYGVFDENDEYELSLGVFDFDEESRIKGTTVYLQHWGSVIDFLDLSDAIEQDENIYILKNISNAKQFGAICKLYRNVKNHEGIIKRQEDLIQKLGSQVVEYDDAAWIIVNSIKKEDLNNEEKFKDVLHKFLEDFIKYAFTVEFISKGY